MTPDQRTKSAEANSSNEPTVRPESNFEGGSKRNSTVEPSMPRIANRRRPKPNWSLRLLALLLLFAGLGYAFLLWWGEGPKAKQKTLTHTITRGDLIVTVMEQGTIESSNNKEIKNKVRGKSVVTWVIPSGTYVEPGDELVRLDTKRIEDEIGRGTTDAYVAKATYERTKADVARAEIAIDAYLEGTYRSQLKALEKRLELAQSNLEAATETLENSRALFGRGFINKFEFQSNEFSVTNAELELKIQKTAINVLNKYTKEMELQTLRGNLSSLKSKLKADEAGLAMDEGRRDRATKELEYCKIVADRSGLVIYPSAAAWSGTPDVTEGGSVRHDQVLLLIPDLTQMQVKVGIHESLISRIEKGMKANVSLAEFDLEGNVAKVANVAKPAGWWTGNMVKYDTVIELPGQEGLKPGMSAEVEVILDEYRDVLLLPVAAVVETEREKLCWVETTEGIEQRVIKLGDSNDVFVEVKAGLAEGENVVLNPLKYVDDAKDEALRALDERSDGPTSDERESESAVAKPKLEISDGGQS